MVTSQLVPATFWTLPRNFVSAVLSFAWQTYILNWLGSILIKTLNLRTSLPRKPRWKFLASQIKRGRRFLCIKVTLFTYQQRCVTIQRTAGQETRKFFEAVVTPSKYQCWQMLGSFYAALKRASNWTKGLFSNV